MIAVFAVLCTMLATAGAVTAFAAARGAIPPRPKDPSSTDLWKKAVDNLRRTPRRTLLRVGGGIGLGLVMTYLLRWPILLVLVPAAVIGLPRLLADPPTEDVRLLESLDRWVRGMLAQMSTGKSIADALRLSARQSPPLLAEPLAVLVRRLDDRWTTPQALYAMADELHSPDSDAVLAALVLSAQRGGTGASVTLHALADSIHDQLRALREIEAERAKPRVVVRQVTGITVVTLLGFMVLSPEFFAPYGTPIGQLVLTVLLSAYVLAVWAMRRMTLPRSRARILRPLT